MFRWPIGGIVEGAVLVEDIMGVVLRKKIRPRLIDFRELCHKNMESKEELYDMSKICEVKFKDGKYLREEAGAADVPGLLLNSTENRSDNPCGLPFTMLDGSHRICLLKEYGAKQGMYYVLDQHDILPLITELPDKFKIHNFQNREEAITRKKEYDALLLVLQGQPKFPLSKDDALDLAWKLARDYYTDVVSHGLIKHGEMDNAPSVIES